MKSAAKSKRPWLGLAVVLFGVPCAAQPITGMQVPALSSFDTIMQDFMNDNGIVSGVLAVSNQGCIVYQRGFGWLDSQFPPFGTPENTPMRIASVEKPITAAAVRRLAVDPDVNMQDNLGDLVFNGGGDPNFNPAGILPQPPWSGVGDARLANITVMDLINHRGGWDVKSPATCLRCNPTDDCAVDPQFSALLIDCALGTNDPPPGREDTVSFMLSQPLQFCPGQPNAPAAGMPCPAACGASCPNACNDGPRGGGCYSNFGYMLLGMIVEQISGMNHIDYIRRNVLTPDMWVPATEIDTGYTTVQSEREPRYVTPSCDWVDVFDPDGPHVCPPYGGWEQEVFIGHGNLVASAAPLMAFMDTYQVNNGGSSGTPLDGALPQRQGHNGSVPGTNAVMFQRADGRNIAVLFNARHPSEGADDGMGGTFPNWAGQLAGLIDSEIDNLLTDAVTWPTTCVDGFWVDFDATDPGFYGAYDYPFNGLDDALGNTVAGSKLRFKPGSTNWTGTLAMRMRLDSPAGAATIGR